MKVSKIIIEHEGEEFVFPVYEEEGGFWTTLEVRPGWHLNTQTFDENTYDELIKNVKEAFKALIEEDKTEKEEKEE